MPEPKIYLPKCNAKEHTFQDGGSMIKLGLNVEATIAFLQQYKNEKGFANLCISKRREVSQYGETHSVSLDTWQPGQQSANPTQTRHANAPAGQKTQAQLELERRKQSGSNRQNPAPTPAPDNAAPDPDDDVPF